MHLKLSPPLVAAPLSCVLLLLSACASTSGTSATASGSMVVAVTGSSKVALGSTAQYAASVTGSSNQAVVWSVNQTAGGSALTGAISANGLYSAPATMPASATVVIAAVSAANSSISGILAVTLQPAAGASAPSVVVTGPAIATLGFPAQYAVTVANLSSNTVLWAVNGVSGGNATAGTITANGLYTPPSAVPSPPAISITATSTASTSISGTLPVTIQAPLASATAAARFLDQTSFGPTATSIAHVQQIGLPAALLEQFHQPSSTFTVPPAADAECSATTWRCTQSDFLKIAAWGDDQLRQRVAMALSEVWVAPSLENGVMPFYANTLAGDAFTNYRQIMQDATLSPAMGSYLNMLNSGKAAKGQIANENFGREMMQLFSLGPDLLNSDGTLQTDGQGNPKPAYTESQVEAFARAYTGWTYANADGGVPAQFNYTANWNHLMVAVESRHDQTQKALLNGTTLPAGQSAEQDLTGALDNIFAHANVGPFVCRQLIQHLITGNPSNGYVQRVSAVFANNGSGVRGDMQAVLTAIVMDEEARAGDAQTGDQAESNPAVDGGHLREPLLWTINLVRGLGATQADPQDAYPFVFLMSQQVAATGEAPFNQTSVFNYFSPAYVIPQTKINSPEFGLENTAKIVPRLSLANAMLHNLSTGLNVDLSATSAIGQQAGNPQQLADYLGMLFMHSQMPTDMRSGLISAISAIPVSDLQSRAAVAVYLVVTSSQYKIMH